MKPGHLIALGTFACIAIIVVLMFGMPVYNVWQQGLAGEAKLKRAEQEKLIMIEQAKAEVEASEHRAKAIKTVGEMAKMYPEYRLQEFIGAFATALEDGSINQIIYVPTEANIPIMEASRLK